MKAKDLINELQKYDPDTEVAIYNNSSGTPLWIPDYDLHYQVSQSESFAEEYDMPKNTVFITGK